MSIALWCVLIAGILPIACTGAAKFGARDFDNAKPREWQAGLKGWRARANAAQNNGFEAFPFFAVAVLVATTQSAANATVDLIAVAWVVFRLAYIAAYLADRSTIRSAMFAFAFFAAVAIFTAPVWN